MSGSVRIGDRVVGGGSPCFVIAEAGVNHNGELELAKRLVDAAAEAGADAVKFQTWETEKLVAAGAPLAAYQRERATDGVADQRQLLESLELTHDDFRELERHARARQILFLSTPDEEDSADFLAALGVPAFKVGSPEVTSLPFLRHLGGKGRPVILSTGMSTLSEVEAAVAALDESGAPGIVLLQCTSSYPAPAEAANLAAMETLRHAFRRPVGYSDHTLGAAVAVGAVALGACVLEKHLTLDRELPGPDHAASLDPAEFAQLVRMVRAVESALGDGVKRIAEVERDALRTMRKVLVAARPLAAGETLGPADVVLRRSVGGLPGSFAEAVLGRAVREAVGAGEPITLELLA